MPRRPAGRRGRGVEAEAVALLDREMHAGSEWHDLDSADRLAVIAAARAMPVREVRRRMLTDEPYGVVDHARIHLGAGGLL